MVKLTAKEIRARHGLQQGERGIEASQCRACGKTVSGLFGWWTEGSMEIEPEVFCARCADEHCRFQIDQAGAAGYATFRQDHPKPWCWYCGRSDRERPSWWHSAPWLIERAHIVSKPRAEDRRAVILLCSLCHKASHGERFASDDEKLPMVTREIMVWLKRHRDPEWYDRDFLQRHCVGRLPGAAKPSPRVIRAYLRRRDRFANI